MLSSCNSLVMNRESVQRMSPRQPCLNSQNRSISVVSFAHLMTIEETAIWIWTFGYHRGWQEAETCAINFRLNNVSGAFLPQLNDHNLQFFVGITKSEHRGEVLSAVRYLFPMVPLCYANPATGCPLFDLENPNSSMNTSCSLYDSNADFESVTSVSVCPTVTGKITQADCYDITSESGNSKFCSVFGCVGSDYYQDDKSLQMPQFTGVRKSCVGSVINEDVGVAGKPAVFPFGYVRRQIRHKKLQTTIVTDESLSCESQMDLIRSRFKKMNFDVKVEKSKKKPQTFVITFKDYTEATTAHGQADKIGYPLTFKRPVRPGPNRPVQYKSLEDLEIREGKSMKGNCTGILGKGEIVTVNQLKRNRARLTKQNEDGELVTLGWVSVHNSNGVQLTPLNDE